jgi:hypothetical protein
MQYSLIGYTTPRDGLLQDPAPLPEGTVVTYCLPLGTIEIRHRGNALEIHAISPHPHALAVLPWVSNQLYLTLVNEPR